MSPILNRCILQLFVAIALLASCGGGNDENKDTEHIADLDGDGHASPLDCDDSNTNIYPGAVEVVADGIDGDCDGFERCYLDEDGDDFGTSATVDSADLNCQGVGEATIQGDCDDANPWIHPGAEEIAVNGVDEDCDGNEACFADDDGDRFGSTVIVAGTDMDCSDPGESYDSRDCDDTDPDISPEGEEIVNDGIDQDCDGSEVCYADEDDDGFGCARLVFSESIDCSGPWSADNADDCDDDAAETHPGAPEIPGDEIDQDCDSRELCYLDGDQDGYGFAPVFGYDWDCSEPDHFVSADDCDDSSSSVHPGAIETCDGVDDDCNGVIDDRPLYQDADVDGYGNPLVSMVSCDSLEGWSAESGDCDDSDSSVHPRAMEVCDDGVDNDCNGSVGHDPRFGQGAETEAKAVLFCGGGLPSPTPLSLPHPRALVARGARPAPRKYHQL